MITETITEESLTDESMIFDPSSSITSSQITSGSEIPNMVESSISDVATDSVKDSPSEIDKTLELEVDVSESSGAVKPLTDNKSDRLENIQSGCDSVINVPSDISGVIDLTVTVEDVDKGNGANSENNKKVIGVFGSSKSQIELEQAVTRKSEVRFDTQVSDDGSKELADIENDANEADNNKSSDDLSKRLRQLRVMENKNEECGRDSTSSIPVMDRFISVDESELDSSTKEDSFEEVFDVDDTKTITNETELQVKARYRTKTLLIIK